MGFRWEQSSSSAPKVPVCALRSTLVLGENQRFLVLQKDDIAAAVHPETLIDTFQDRKDIAVGVFGRTGMMRLSSRGDFDPKWMSRLGNAASTNFFDGQHLVSAAALKAAMTRSPMSPCPWTI